MRRFAIILILVLWPAWAGAFEPAVLFDTWKLDDKGYVESAHNGVVTFRNFRNLPVTIVTPDKKTPPLESEFVQIVVDTLKKGYDPIISIGFSYEAAFAQLAPQYPRTRFIIIDAMVPGSNIQSIVFREEEGSFLVGYLAGMATRNHKIGFVGGMDSELIRKFGCAFAQGALYMDPDLEIFTVMAGDTVDAWIDPDRGAALTRELIRKGVDVVFHAAGMTGDGVIQAAAEAGIMAIGVDTNQNHMAPQNMLTSMLKRMDVAVFLALGQVADGRWAPGIETLGLKEGAIDWAIDKYNIAFITEDMQDRMDELTFDILAGILDVYKYKAGKPCPYVEFSPVSK